MDASVNGDLDGADLEDDDDFVEAHEINVTPFIDVMLVLLIIFMVAAPLSTVDLPVDLPSSTASPQKRLDKPLYVTIKADLAVAVGETPVKRADLVRAIDTTASGEQPDHDRRIFLRADRVVPYGELMDVLEVLRTGGYAKVALVALEAASARQPVEPRP
jgi:biopolymer transport protein ExbD